MKKLFLLAFFTVLFVACSDDDSPSNVVIPQLPVEVYYLLEGKSDSSKTVYEYDASLRLTKTHYEEEGFSSDEIFIYNNSGLVKIEEKYSAMMTVYTIMKSGNQIEVEEQRYDKSGNTIWDPYQWIITLNAKGLPARIEKDGKSVSYTTYKYDSNNNITEVRKYKDGNLYSVTTATYDNKQGFMSQINTPVWAFVCMDSDNAISGYFNNPLSMTKTYEDGDAYTDNYTYEYDWNNYPVQITKISEEEPGIGKIIYKKY